MDRYCNVLQVKAGGAIREQGCKLEVKIEEVRLGFHP